MFPYASPYDSRQVSTLSGVLQAHAGEPSWIACSVTIRKSYAVHKVQLVRDGVPWVACSGLASGAPTTDEDGALLPAAGARARGCSTFRRRVESTGQAVVNFTVDQTVTSMEGRYECVASFSNKTVNATAKSASRRLVVLEYPQSVDIAVPPTLNSGAEAALTCSAAGGKPAAVLQWALLDPPPGRFSVVHEPDLSYLRGMKEATKLNTSSTLRFAVDWSWDGKVVRCYVANHGRRGIESVKRIAVNYIRLVGSDSVKVVHCRSATAVLRCSEYVDSKPRADYEWREAGAADPVGRGDSLTIAYTAAADFNASAYHRCTATNPVTKRAAEVNFHSLWVPDGVMRSGAKAYLKVVVAVSVALAAVPAVAMIVLAVIQKKRKRLDFQEAVRLTFLHRNRASRLTSMRSSVKK